MSLSEFYDLLEKHDWFYAMSDDPKVVNRGAAQERKLMAIASQSEEHTLLRQAYHEYKWSKLKKVQKTKPERPSK